LYVNVNMKPGRNDPCLCGSGKKYKKCCALESVSQTASTARESPAQDPDMSPLIALLNSGRYADLETSARALLERYPESGMLWKLSGVALWMQGRDPLEAFEEAARLMPDDAESHGNLGNVLRARGRLDEAADSHRRAIEARPDYAEAHNNLGSVLRDQARFDDAVASYRRALAIKPDFAMAHDNLGLVLRSLGRLDQAVSSHRRALVMKPDFAEAHAHLGEALSALGRFADAAVSFRRSRDLKPGYADVEHGLGTALLRLGRAVEAAASYRHALELKPDFADAHNNLGSALRDLGRLDEAAASYRRALELKPDYAEAHNNLGNVQMEIGLPEEAALSYQRALQLRPDYVKALGNLGSAYREIGQLEEAAASYRRALELQPDFIEVLTHFGILHRMQGHAAEAEANCRRALELKPSAAAALVLLAELNSDRGRFEEAEALYRQAIAIEPDSPFAWSGIAALRKLSSADAAWAAEVARIAAQPRRSREEIHLRYAMGKYFDDTRDFAEAFSNYRRANELTKAGRAPHDRGRVTEGFDFVAGFHDAQWLSHARAHGNPSERPVLIVGMPRSGTSLSEQILASHPDVFGAGELWFWKNAVTRMASAEFEARTPESFLPQLAEDYLAELGGISGAAPRVVDKMPSNFLHLGLIHAALPNARIIHMRRSPIDTCLSIYFQNFHRAHTYANDLEDLAHYYAEYERLMAHWRAALPAQIYLEVPYEALVDEPETWSRRMVEFIGLSWDPACLDSHRTSRSVSTFSKWQVRQKIGKTSVARWRNYAQFVGPLTRLEQDPKH
jgi:tetratricopeptide (TPR) repeat protein